jgi:hypothetical protein
VVGAGVVVAVVVVAGVVVGALVVVVRNGSDPTAWAGTITDSTIGFIQLDGRPMVTSTVPPATTVSTRRRVTFSDFIR